MYGSYVLYIFQTKLSYNSNQKYHNWLLYKHPEIYKAISITWTIQ